MTNIKNSKRAELQKIIFSVIITIVAIIVIFKLVGTAAPDIIAASNNISGSGLPFASMFASSGIVLFVFMVFLFLAIVAIAMKMAKHE